MKRKSITAYRRYILLPMLAVVLILSAATVQASSGYAEIQVPVSQKFEVKQGIVPAGGNIFSYTFTSKDAGSPMPEGSKDGVYSFTMKDTQKENLAAITYKQVGEYEYELRQAVTDEKEGYHYDQQTYQVLVSVRSREGSGLYADLIIKNEAGEKAEEAFFENTYTGKKQSGSTGTNGTSPNYTTPASQGRPLVKTGDETKLSLLLALLAGSFLVLIVAAGSRQKKKKDHV